MGYVELAKEMGFDLSSPLILEYQDGIATRPKNIAWASYGADQKRSRQGVECEESTWMLSFMAGTGDFVLLSCLFMGQQILKSRAAQCHQIQSGMRWISTTTEPIDMINKGSNITRLVLFLSNLS